VEVSPPAPAAAPPTPRAAQTPRKVVQTPQKVQPSPAKTKGSRKQLEFAVPIPPSMFYPKPSGGPSGPSGEACLTVTGSDPDTPTYAEAMAGPHKTQWLDAMNDEIKAMAENNVWELVDPPNGARLIQTRWVLRIKRKPDRSIDRFRARLVAKGYSQRAGYDYEDTFSPVARFDTVRLLMALATLHKLSVQQLDIKTAFLHGELKETIYMAQPIGFDDQSGRACLLNRSLYGLKQSPRCWNEKLTNYLAETGWTETNADPCLFTHQDPVMYLVIYVDDGLVFYSNDKDIADFSEQMKTRFESTFGPATCYLGIEITKLDDDQTQLTQSAYAKRVVERFNMADANGMTTPYVNEDRDEDSAPVAADTPYREAVGSLLYLAGCTRPDISFAVSRASRHLADPTEQDWTAVKRILKYVLATYDYGPVYSKSVDSADKLRVYSDADFGGCSETRRSTSGVIALFAGAPVIWTSKRQISVSLSTTEAEFIAASEAAKEAVWAMGLLSELSINIETPTLCIDNKSTLALIDNPMFHQRTKHIDVRYKFIREHCQGQRIKTVHVPAVEQHADMLTKGLAGPAVRSAARCVRLFID
jgi:hypothetical protein